MKISKYIPVLIITLISVLSVSIMYFWLIQKNETIVGLESTLTEQNEEILYMAASLFSIKSEKELQDKLEATYNFILPIHKDDFVAPTSPYGIRDIPKGIYTGGSTTREHFAVDLKGTWKARIVASADGIVKEKWYVPDESKGRRGHDIYGGYIVILHTDGSETEYAHMSWINPDLHEGDSVKQGAVMGRQGNTGQSDGAHLHFALKIGGIYVNPLKYIKFY